MFLFEDYFISILTIFNINYYYFFLILLLFDITIIENYLIILILDINNYYLIVISKILHHLSSSNGFIQSIVSLKNIIKASDNIFPDLYLINYR